MTFNFFYSILARDLSIGLAISKWHVSIEGHSADAPDMTLAFLQHPASLVDAGGVLDGGIVPPHVPPIPTSNLLLVLRRIHVILVRLFLGAQVGVKDELLAGLALVGLALVEGLLHDSVELGLFRFLRFELLEELMVVWVKDQHVLVRHLGEGVVWVDDRPQQLLVL